MKKDLLASVLVFLGLTALEMPATGLGAASDNAQGSAVEVRQMEFGGLSPELRHMPTHDVGRGPAMEQVRQRSFAYSIEIPGPPEPAVVDRVTQTSAGPLVAATTGLGFAGVGQGDYGHADCCAPLIP